MPKYIDMRRQARIAALEGMAGAIRTAIASAEAAFMLSTDEKKNGGYLTIYFPDHKTGGSTILNLYGKQTTPTSYWPDLRAASGNRTLVGVPVGHQISGLIESCEDGVYSTYISKPYKCSNGFSVIQAGGSDFGMMGGTFFFPPGVNVQPSNNIYRTNGQDDGYIENGEAPKCFVAYQTTAARNNIDEHYVIQTAFGDC